MPNPLALLEGLFQRSPVPYAVFAQDGSCVLTNPAFAAMFGAVPPEGYDLFQDEVLKKTDGLMEAVEAAFAGKTVKTPTFWHHPETLRHVRVESAHRVAIRCTVFPLRAAGGRASHVAVAYQDLTAELAAQESAASERDLLRSIIEQTGDGIVVADQHGVMQLANAAAQRYHGRVGKPLHFREWPSTYELLDETGRPMAPEELPLARAVAGQGVPRARWQARHPDGSVRMLEGAATPLVRPDGSAAGGILTVRDVTSEAQARAREVALTEALAQVQRRLTDALEAGQLGLWEWNARSQSLWRSEGHDALYGLRPNVGEATHSTFLERVHPDDQEQVLAAAKGALTARGPYAVEFRVRWPDGSLRWLLAKGRLVRGAAGQASAMSGATIDITDRKAAEAEREQFFQLTPDLFCIAGIDGELRRTNEAFRRTLGYSEEELQARPLLDFVHPEDVSVTRAELARLSEGHPTSRFVSRCRRKDGTYCHLSWVATPSLAAGLLYASARDITAQRRNESSLRFLAEASRVLSASLEPAESLGNMAQLAARAVSTACFVDLVQPDGSLVRAAAASRDEALTEATRRVLAGLPDLSRPAVRAALDSSEAQRDEAQDLSLLFIPMSVHGRAVGLITVALASQEASFADGDRGFAEELGRRAAVALENGRLHRETLRAEKEARFLSDASFALAASLEVDETLRSVAQLAVPFLGDWCVVDIMQPDGRYRRVEIASHDPAHASLAERAKQFTLLPLAKEASPPTAAVRGPRAVLVNEVDEAYMRRTAQSPAHLALMRELNLRSIISAPMRARSRTLGVLTFVLLGHARAFSARDLALAEDLAHRASLALDNARLYQEAQEAVRLRDDFLSVASHELRTPLTPLGLKLQTLEAAVEAPEVVAAAPRLRAHVKMALRQTRKLGELVADLLDVTRISTGRLQLTNERVDLRELAQEVVSRFEPLASRMGSQVEVVVSSAPVIGTWDRSRLDQVLSNLLSNALKYGGGALVRLTLSREGQRVRLEVADLGIGIPPEALERIFSKYERAVSDRHYGGLGLGLFITRQLVEAMGGRVWARSGPETGATFVVELPTVSP